MISGALRADSVNLPLLLHVTGATILVGVLAVVAASLLRAAGGREPGGTLVLARFGFRALLIGAIPSYLLMRISAEWLVVEENLDELEEDPAWIGIGYITTDIGLLLLIAATVLSGLAARKLRAEPGAMGRGGRAAAVLCLLLLLAYTVAIWAMTAKPAWRLPQNPPRTSGGGGSARCGVLGRAMALPLPPPCVLAPLDPALASRTRGVSSQPL